MQQVGRAGQRHGEVVVAYSGDSGPTPLLAEVARGADLFVCECTTFESEIPRHVRYLDIEANRDRFDCGRLLLTHLGREMRERSGEIPEELANDGLEIALK